MFDSQGEPLVVITTSSVRRGLTPSDSLGFGRGRDQDIRIGSEPEDLRVPRRCGVLECRETDVLVHNVSEKKLLLVRTFDGPILEIAPRTSMGLRRPVIQILVAGGEGRQYAVNVDSRRMPGLWNEDIADDGEGATVGYDRVHSLTSREKQLLLALCLPAVTGQVRRGEVPTYAGIEEILRERGVLVVAARVRKGLDALRRKLAEQHGIDELLEDDAVAVAGGKQSYLPALAHWAMASGTVTYDDVDRFDRGDLHLP